MKTNNQGRIELHITDGAGKALNEQIVVILNENAAQFGHAVRLEGTRTVRLAEKFRPVRMPRLWQKVDRVMSLSKFRRPRARVP